MQQNYPLKKIKISEKPDCPTKNMKGNLFSCNKKKLRQ